MKRDGANSRIADVGESVDDGDLAWLDASRTAMLDIGAFGASIRRHPGRVRLAPGPAATGTSWTGRLLLARVHMFLTGSDVVRFSAVEWSDLVGGFCGLVVV